MTMTTTTTTEKHDGPPAIDPPVALLARLVRTLLADQSFGSLADLADAVRWRCAQLKIPHVRADQLSAAFALIASNRPLTHDPRRRRPAGAGPTIGASPDGSRADAARVVQGC